MFEKMWKLVKRILLFCVAAVITFLFLSVPIILATTSSMVVIISLLLPIAAGIIVVHIASKNITKKHEIAQPLNESTLSLETSPKAEPTEDNSPVESIVSTQCVQQQDRPSQTDNSVISDKSCSREDEKEITEAAATESVSAAQEEINKNSNNEIQEPTFFGKTDNVQSVDVNADLDSLIEKEDSFYTVIKEEFSCWNWQLIIGVLIFGIGFFNLFSSFFFAIMLLVFGLGLLSIGSTKYKEKKELQERELKRKIMAAVAKSSPSEEKTASAPIAKSTAAKAPADTAPKGKTHKVAGVTHYVENIIALGIENEDYYKTKRDFINDGQVDERIWQYEFYPDDVELVPEPDNP